MVMQGKTGRRARPKSATTLRATAWLGMALGAVLATTVTTASLADSDPVGIWVVVINGDETCEAASEFVALLPQGSMTAMDSTRVGFGTWTIDQGAMTFDFRAVGMMFDTETRDWRLEDMSSRAQTFPGNLLDKDRIEILGDKGAPLAHLTRCSSPTAGK